jgi:hypothetical protein
MAVAQVLADELRGLVALHRLDRDVVLLVDGLQHVGDVAPDGLRRDAVLLVPGLLLGAAPRRSSVARRRLSVMRSA